MRTRILMLRLLQEMGPALEHLALPRIEEAEHRHPLGDVLLLLPGEMGEELPHPGILGARRVGLVLADRLEFPGDGPAKQVQIRHGGRP